MSNVNALSLDLAQSVEIKSALEDAYRALIRRLTDANSTPDNKLAVSAGADETTG